MATRTVSAASERSARRPGIAPERQRLFFALLVLASMLVLCAPFFVDLIARDAPRAQAGEVSYRDWGRLDAPVELNGEWRLVWRGGAAAPIPPGTVLSIDMPNQWSNLDRAGAPPLPGAGVASFELTIRDLAPGLHMLHIPIMYGALRVVVDGRVVAQAGRVGSGPHDTVTTVRSIAVPIDVRGGPIALRLDVASFHHRDTGFVQAPVLARAEPMQVWIALEWTKDLLFQTSLLLLAANAFVAFLFRRTDRASLYLSLAAMCSIAPTAIVSHDNLLMIALPGLGFDAMLAIQYLLTIVALMLFFAYAHMLFREESPRPVFRAVQAVTGVYLALQLSAFAVGDTSRASDYAMAWPVVAGLTVAAIIAIVVRAVVRVRDGAIVFLLGIGAFAFAFFNSSLIWAGLVSPNFGFGPSALPLGMLVLLFSHFIVSAERWSLAIVSAERTTSDLRELIEVNQAITSEIRLDALLARIVEATSRILRADRSTLLLHDPKTDELWSLIAEGMTTREIRVPANSGLAGAAFKAGAMVNIADAYDDPRFIRDYDIANGYRTKSILSMPIVARDGRKLGVMQALNRREGGAFDAVDERRMSAFASQAAIAIDNATLFSEVVAAKNYNESILRSMSSGVITLDRDASVAKLNEAACRILELPAQGVEGQDARALLARRNPWLLDEIDTVAATGEPKMLIDVDVRTAREAPISVNISIVPLIGESEPVGLLMLIEDISEGKRLQGAMRRFMTQKVMDQVLGRDDDLLFGTACEASVLFADIRGFTSIAEGLTPRETVDMLNEAFTDFFEAVSEYDGVLDKFIGDAIMAVYGAPLTTGRDPDNAVESGVQMLRMLDLLNERRAGRAHPPLRLGVGIASGEVVAGTIGSPKRMDYTVIGDSVNLAARLQDLTKAYGIEMLVCEKTAAAIGDGHKLREIDVIRVRGRQRPAKIFEVFPRPPADALAFDALLAAYDAGRALMAARDWAGAKSAFDAALAAMPDDRPSQLMRERAAALVSTPPADDWDGVWAAAAKG